jgi:hypothetical protein
MRAYEMRFPGFDARSNLGPIRWELFLHRDVRDVVPTPRHDTLCVVFRGELDPAGWAQTLAEAGLPRPVLDGEGVEPEVGGPYDAAA